MRARPLELCCLSVPWGCETNSFLTSHTCAVKKWTYRKGFFQELSHELFMWNLSETSLLSLQSFCVNFLMFLLHAVLYFRSFVLSFSFRQSKSDCKPLYFDFSCWNYISHGKFQKPKCTGLVAWGSAACAQAGWLTEGQRQDLPTCSDADTWLFCAVPCPYETTQTHSILHHFLPGIITKLIGRVLVN